MNLAQLIDRIAVARPYMTKRDIENVLHSFMDVTRNEVREGGEVRLVTFGTFLLTKHKARLGRNPQTGKTIKIPARWAPKFRPTETFKSFIQEKR